MGARAALLSEKAGGLRLLERPEPPQFKTRWPLTADKAQEPEIETPAPAGAARVFADWTIDLAELHSEPFSFGSLLVALRSKLSKGRSQLSVHPANRPETSQDFLVERYSLEVTWKDGGCELKFIAS